MNKPPYKIPLKKRLANGGTMNNTVDAAGIGVASAFGPWWGMLAQGGVETAKKIRGDSQNTARNVASDIADPFNQFKNNKSAGDWATSFALPGVSSVIKGKRMKREANAAREEAARLEREQQAATTMSLDNERMRQYSQIPLAKGGKMQGPAKAVKGGTLEPIGGGAVRVKADNPNATDSVELPGAFVDHNEVIKGKKVYSDDIKVDGKKSVADEAEKAVKSGNNRKLKGLFNSQQEYNTPKTRTLERDRIIPLMKEIPMKADKTKYTLKRDRF